MTSSTATLVRKRNARVLVYEGTYPKLITVTTLLIDRSLSNQGCVAHKFLIICTDPQHAGPFLFYFSLFLFSLVVCIL
jgi:hypothetical protein